MIPFLGNNFLFVLCSWFCVGSLLGSWYYHIPPSHNFSLLFPSMKVYTTQGVKKQHELKTRPTRPIQNRFVLPCQPLWYDLIRRSADAVATAHMLRHFNCNNCIERLEIHFVMPFLLNLLLDCFNIHHQSCHTDKGATLVFTTFKINVFGSDMTNWRIRFKVDIRPNFITK